MRGAVKFRGADVYALSNHADSVLCPRPFATVGPARSLRKLVQRVPALQAANPTLMGKRAYMKEIGTLLSESARSRRTPRSR